MIKFWDRVVIVLMTVGFIAIHDLVATPLGMILSLVMWVIFHKWLDSTFVSISYIRELQEKANNDNKNSGSTNT